MKNLVSMRECLARESSNADGETKLISGCIECLRLFGPGIQRTISVAWPSGWVSLHEHDSSGCRGDPNAGAGVCPAACSAFIGKCACLAAAGGAVSWHGDRNDISFRY